MKYALRQLRRNPAFTVTALAVLAIGIGANTAVFSVVNTMLLKPLAVPQPGRVVQLMRRNQHFDLYCVAVADLFVWQAQTQILEDVSAYSYVPDKLSRTGGDTPEQISAEHVSRDYFRLFGARIVLGRVFTAEEDQPRAGNFVVLSGGLWQRRYGSDPEIAGKTILFGGDSYKVVGVLDPAFHGDRSVDVWLPLQADRASAAGCSLWGAARLKPGVTLTQAKSVLRLAAEDYKRQHPAHTTFLGEAAMPADVTYTAEPMESILTGDVRPALEVLLAAVACVLLIGCANIAGLLLVSGIRRSQEIAIRSALGASRARIVRQLLAESTVLSVAGGVFGLLIAVLVIKLLPPLEPMNIARIGPGARPVAVDGTVLAVTAFLSILTGVLSGVLPALQASRADLSHHLKQRRMRLRGILVTVEIALSVALLTGAGLMVRSFLALRSQPPGFDAHSVLVFETALTGSAFDHVSGFTAVARRVEDRLRAIPGVEEVSAADSVPLLPNLGRAFEMEGRTAGSRWRAVTPGYFAVFRIPVPAGRGFRASDDSHGPPVVVINQTLARQYWPGRNPVGRTISFLSQSGAREPAAEIVGVVADVREVNLKGPAEPVVYVPLDQVDDRFLASVRVWLQSLTWSVRTRTAPGSILPKIPGAIRDAAGLPVSRIRPMEQIVADSTAHDAWQTELLAAFAFGAMLLAAIGLHGMLAYSIEQRTFEFGVRLAVGANAAQLRRMVLLDGMRHAGAGILIGSGGAFALARLMRALLFGVRPYDPVVFAAVPVLLGLVTLGAGYLPSRRISAIDAAAALRVS